MEVCNQLQQNKVEYIVINEQKKKENFKKDMIASE